MRPDVTAAVQAQYEADESNPLLLLKIAYTDGTIEYKTNLGRRIEYNGQTWLPDSFTHTDISTNRSGTRTSCQINFNGPNHAIGVRFRAAGGGIGHTFTLYNGMLDANRAVIADPIILISGKSTSASRTHDKTTLQIEQDATAWASTVPSQSITTDVCQAVFQGNECQYGGSPTTIGHIFRYRSTSPQRKYTQINFRNQHQITHAENVVIAGVLGMVELNGNTYVATAIVNNIKPITAWASSSSYVRKITVGAGHGFTAAAGTWDSGYVGGDYIFITGLKSATPAQRDHIAFYNNKYWLLTASDATTISFDTRYQYANDNFGGAGHTGWQAGDVVGGWAICCQIQIEAVHDTPLDSRTYGLYTSGGTATYTASWCDKTRARCTTLGNLAHALFFVDAIAPGDTVNMGTGYDVPAGDRNDEFMDPPVTGHLGITKGGAKKI